ncbi:HAD family hydrolase [Pleionea sp. CnH1-48]|uniref:HAD family hydrolase n=1 Tax=Pleionea sp. CnH1-48 TaxID=2954494 RepID=UPI00209811BB|nr:HAD-IA family hydrolase [Pleionea sp. CnH1-48]MCO7225860.1 HAD-IA family hydrolase [Pleionea sp. CnH1-48]
MKTDYQFVVFDWDGTLMDSAPRIVSSMSAAARQLSLPVPSDDDIRHIIGLSLDETFNALFPETNEQQRTELFEAYREEYVTGNPTPTPLFRDAEHILKSLKERGYRLAVATGKGRQGLERVFRESGIGHWFDDSICAGEAESKPHPDMLLQLLSRNQIDADATLMVGDTSHDLSMAAAANVDAVGVSFGAHGVEKLTPHQPQLIIDHLSQLLDWLHPVSD